MGCIYKRKWKGKKTGEVVGGETWWIKYYRNGKPYHESTRSEKEADAKRLLKRREGEIAKGELPGICFDKVRFDELAEDLLTDYRINEKRTLDKATCCVGHLKDAFEGMRVTEISTARIKEYVDRRMEEGLTNASINRELAALKRMFHLASQCTPPKVGQVPYIPMLKESNTRKGFFEYEAYLRLKDALPYYLKPVATFAYHTGWRAGEILNLTWDKVDIREMIIRLDPGETKNKQARTIYLNDELKKEIRALHSNRRLGCPYVFHRDGQPILRFNRSWRTACIKAGLCEPRKDAEGKTVTVKDKQGNEKIVMVPTKLFHDFRRTGIRNMVRSGISERVAMMISGHKTRAVFDRYNIVSDQDLKEAAVKQQNFINSQTVPENSYSYGDSQPKVVSFEEWG
jgi:integrase